MTGFTRYAAVVIALLFAAAGMAQQRSTNVQTIDGKKFYIHRVEKSQSLYAIGKLYNVPLETLYAINPELKQGVKVGQEIRVPVVPPPPPPAVIDSVKFITHRVAKGETVYSILRKYNLTEKELLAFNPAVQQNGLKEGQIIVVGERPKKRPAAPPPARPAVLNKEPRTVPAPLDSFLFKPVNRPMKESYNVALILPFRLDRMKGVEAAALAKANAPFPPVPALAVDFYMGFKKAVDSVSAPGFSLDLRLYDADENDTARLAAIAASASFRESDICFGPVYADGFKTIANKARELNFPIVSPLTQQNKILFNNIYVSKTNPSQFTLLESLADYCLDSLLAQGGRLILMSAGNDRREANYVADFRKYYNDRVARLGRPQDTARSARGLPGAKAAYAAGMPNVVVTLSRNQVFIADFTTQLALFADKKDIVLCGWQDVSTMDNIDQEYLNQLRFTFPHPFNLTADWSGTTKGYHETMGTSPSEYFNIGHDVALYYLGNLKKNGPGFIYLLETLIDETSYMRFRFTRPDSFTGYDNRGMYIFRYHDYQLRKTGWK